MLTDIKPAYISQDSPFWPEIVGKRLGANASDRIEFIGDIAILASRKTALFCSTRCPGDFILKAFDTAKSLRESGSTAISGFHSPVEKECLRILLKGKQPIIICPARSLSGMRVPKEWLPGIKSGRILLLASFKEPIRRASSESCRRRNEFVAAISDGATIIYAEPGGQIEQIATMLGKWRVQAENHSAI